MGLLSGINAVFSGLALLALLLGVVRRPLDFDWWIALGLSSGLLVGGVGLTLLSALLRSGRVRP